MRNLCEDVGAVNFSEKTPVSNQQIQNAYHHGNLSSDILQRAVEIIDEQGLDALSLRGIAKDLGVSHAAPNRHFKNKASLLSAIATGGWMQLRDATLKAADATASDNPNVRLNAMGRGFMRWALRNRALFRTLLHPDVARFADDDLTEAMLEFSASVSDAVQASQRQGRLSDVPLPIVSLFTNAVPMGAALLLINPLLSADHPDFEQFEEEELIHQVINLVVPI